jgi:hypothetical protein
VRVRVPVLQAHLHAAPLALERVHRRELLLAPAHGAPFFLLGVFRRVARAARVAVERDVDALALDVLHAQTAQRTHHARRVLRACGFWFGATRSEFGARSEHGRSDAIRGEKRSRDAMTKKHRSSRSSGRVRPRVGFGIRRLKRLGNAPVWPARRSRAMPCAPSRTSWRTRGTGTAGSPAGRTLRVEEVETVSERNVRPRNLRSRRRKSVAVCVTRRRRTCMLAVLAESGELHADARRALRACPARVVVRAAPESQQRQASFEKRFTPRSSTKRSFEKFLAKPPTVLFCNRRK